MGVVYEAEQDRPRRRFALKVIRPGLVNPKMLRRFEHEYEFLGRLQHPGVAQVYQAGIVESPLGPQPYFAMELVRGRRLDEYVRARQLSLTERLSLVAEIADAVAADSSQARGKASCPTDRGCRADHQRRRLGVRPSPEDAIYPAYRRRRSGRVRLPALA